MKTSPILRVDATVHKESYKARTDFAALLANLVMKSGFYQAEPELQSTGGAVIQAGAELAAADAAANIADAAATVARGVRNGKKIAFDQTYNVFTACVEKHATTPEDLESIGFDELQRNTYPLAAPLSVTAAFDPKTELIKIEVKQAPGMLACFIEISADSVTWKRLPGIAASQSVSGYAPGTYWVRAASARGAAESGFTGPVAVIGSREGAPPDTASGRISRRRSRSHHA